MEPTDQLDAPNRGLPESRLNVPLRFSEERRVQKAFCLSLCTCALLVFTTRTPEATFARGRQATNESVVAFVGATVVPMTSDQLLTDHTVLVRGDQIAAIGPTAKI